MSIRVDFQRLRAPSLLIIHLETLLRKIGSDSSGGSFLPTHQSFCIHWGRKCWNVWAAGRNESNTYSPSWQEAVKPRRPEHDNLFQPWEPFLPPTSKWLQLQSLSGQPHNDLQGAGYLLLAPTGALYVVIPQTIWAFVAHLTCKSAYLKVENVEKSEKVLIFQHDSDIVTPYGKWAYYNSSVR